jgi:thiosulfate reductase cytochrome b subunit
VSLSIKLKGPLMRQLFGDGRSVYVSQPWHPLLHWAVFGMAALRVLHYASISMGVFFIIGLLAVLYAGLAGEARAIGRQ